MNNVTALRGSTMKIVGKGFDALAALRTQLAAKIAPTPKAPLLMIADMRSRVNLEELMHNDLMNGAEEDIKAFYVAARKGKPGYVHMLPPSYDIIEVASNGSAKVITPKPESEPDQPVGITPPVTASSQGDAPSLEGASATEGDSSPAGGGGDPKPKKTTNKSSDAKGTGKDKKAGNKSSAKDPYTLPKLPAEMKITFQPTTVHGDASLAEQPSASQTEAPAETPDVAIGNDEVRSKLKDLAVDAVTPVKGGDSGRFKALKSVLASLAGKK